MEIILNKAWMVIPVALALLGTEAAWADTNLRCGNRLVTVEDSQASIRSKCGEPSEISTLIEPARYRNRWGEWVVDRSQPGNEVTVWVYNFGRDKLMMQLRFVNGTLQDVQPLDYGH